MTHDELRDPIGQALRDLTAPKAPPTLLPRVLEAIRAREAEPWYRRPWVRWPRAVQVGSLVAVVATVALFGVVLPAIQATAFGEASGTLGTVLTLTTGLGRALGALANAAGSVWNAVVGPVVALAFVVGLCLSVTCAGVGVALRKIALGGVIE